MTSTQRLLVRLGAAIVALIPSGNAVCQNQERRPCVEGLARPAPENTLDLATVSPGVSESGQVGFNLDFPHRQGELLIFPSTSGATLASELATWEPLWQQFDAKLVRIEPSLPMLRIQLPITANLDAVARELLQRAGASISSIEANSCVFPQQSSSGSGALDPEAASQWGHWRIGLEEAWKTTTGKSSIVVAVVDSGINHQNPDLACNFWTNSCDVPNGMDDDCPGSPADKRIDDVHGWNFVPPEGNQLSDKADHGTKIAGIIGACRNDIGVVGTNWSISIMDLRTYEVLIDLGFLDAVLPAFEYAAKNGAHLINASWDTSASDSLKTLIRDAPDTIVVTGAGNRSVGERLGSTLNVYPCSWTPELPNLICVTASKDAMDKKLEMANYGDVVQIAAPGEDIRTTEGTATGAGTGVSFAVPYVVGVAALVKTQFPLATTKEVVQRVLCGQELSVLDGVTRPGKTPGTGIRLNAAMALSCDLSEDPSPP